MRLIMRILSKTISLHFRVTALFLRLTLSWTSGTRLRL